MNLSTFTALFSDSLRTYNLIMANTPEIQNRIDLLKTELANGGKRARFRAKVDHWISITLMVLALGASGVAGVGGLSGVLSIKQTGAIALLPGVLALFASVLKFEGKSGWQYRKQQALDDLKDRLLLQLPESPTADQIAEIARKKNELIHDMQRQWEREFSLNWSSVK